MALGPMGKWSLDQRTLNVDFESGRCSCGLLLPTQHLIQGSVMLSWMIVDDCGLSIDVQVKLVVFCLLLANLVPIATVPGFSVRFHPSCQ